MAFGQRGYKIRGFTSPVQYDSCYGATEAPPSFFDVPSRKRSCIACYGIGPSTVYSEENIFNCVRIDYLAHVIKLISLYYM